MLVLRRTIMLSIVFTFASFAFADEPSRGQQVDQMFARWNQPNSPGYTVAVFKDGEVLHSKGYGMANLDEQTPLGPKTPLCLMSLSKSFASVCVAIAMDQGHFAPDDDVRKYVPELHEFKTPIRIRHLITCRSGLRDFYFGMALIGRNVEDVFTSDDALDLILRQKTLMIEPGEEWSYSNSDWFLLAEVLRRTTGKTLREFAEEHLFQPLNMKHTLFQDAPRLPHHDRAVGYAHRENKFTRHESRSDCWQAAGSLWTTTDDMRHWDACLRTKQGLPDGKFVNEFLSKGSLLGNEQCLSAYPSETYRGAKRFWYTGGGLGFVAHYVRFPDHGVSIVVFGNHDTDGSWPCLLYTSPSPRDLSTSRMPSSA